MNILVLGASGFIGSWITTELIKAGHRVTCCVRDVSATQRKFPQAKVIACDLMKDITIVSWKKKLKNIDVLINCIGIFYHPNKNVIWRIHYLTPRIIYEACFEMDVKKIFHISALNVERYNVEYAKSKKAIEDFLTLLDTPHIILKPSLVYGPKAYGGMAFFRALSSLPYIIFVPGKGNQKVQPIHVEDLAQAIINILNERMTNNIIVAAVSSKPISITSLLTILRQWLGWPQATIIKCPHWIIRIINIIGDYTPYSTINSDALKMLSGNNITNEKEVLRFQKIIKFIPRNFEAGVYSYPSQTQDRWHARLVFLKPMLRLSLVFMWLISALTSAFIYPRSASFQLLANIGITPYWQPLLLYGACIINFIIGMTLLVNYKPKSNYIVQIIVIVVYSLIITIKLPYLWTEPFGPIVKNIPILGLILLLLSLEK